MDLRAFKVLSFDCYGTLIDWERGLLAALAAWRSRERVSVSDDDLLVRFGEAETACEAATPSRAYPGILADTLRTLAQGLGVTATPDDCRAFGASVGEWPAFDDSPAGLAYLALHHRLVVLSNVDRASFARSNRKLAGRFAHVFTAEDIGSYKPDPRNFAFMLDRLAADGVARHEVLHVAQSLFHDHVPAKRAGLATVWVDRRMGRPGGGATPPAEAQPDLTVASLAALVDLHRAAAR